jgi:hypothetical protein
VGLQGEGGAASLAAAKGLRGRDDPAARRRSCEQALDGERAARARVVRMPLKTVEPLRTRVTRQRLPTWDWSTSNSVSMRPSSALAFSFQVLEMLHLPVLTTPRPPLVLAAVAVEASTTSSAVSVAIPVIVSLCNLGPFSMGHD